MKKLAKYLADYIEHEHELDVEAKEYDTLDYETIITEGIEAFENMEGNAHPKNMAECEDAKVKSFEIICDECESRKFCDG